jgi:hypothetical protein
MQILLSVIQWIYAAVEALRWQPPDHTMFPGAEQIVAQEKARGGERRPGTLA